MERQINPLFNVFEKYSEVNIINPHRFAPLGFFNEESFDFDGSSGYISHGNNLSFAGNAACSFVFSMKLDSTGSNQRFISKYDLSTDRGYFVGLTSGKLRFFFRAAGTNIVQVEANDSISTGTWYRVAMTKSASTSASAMKIYVNGTASTLNTIQNALGAGSTLNTDDFILGTLSAAYTDGHLDEIGVYDTELSSSDVSDDWNGGEVTDLTAISSAANLQGYWRADGDSTGTDNVIDQSGNGNHGTITGGVTIDTDVP